MKRIKKNDLVKVISGGHKGRIAKVAKIEGSNVFLEKLGLRERHYKGNIMTNGQGTKKEVQLPVHISNVALATETAKDNEKFGKISFAIKNDKKVRVAKNTGKEIK
ncbi:MAG: 50S ribosomal protein L24 [Candidatus Nanoperiomorbaceae bacterium]